MDFDLSTINEYTMQNQELDYLSEDVQEILSTPPSWVAIWGTTVIFMALILMVVVGWNFKHPETVKGDIVLTTSEPPVPVYAKMPGELSDILVKEGQEVTEGEILAVIDDAANYRDVLNLEEELLSMGEFDILMFQDFMLDENLRLGRIRPDYTQFGNTLEEISFLKNSRIDSKSVKGYYDQIKEKEKLIQALQKKEDITNKEIASLELSLKAASKRYQDSADDADLKALIDLNKEKDSKEGDLSDINLELVEASEEITSLRFSISGKNLDAQGKDRQRINDARQKFNILKTTIETWKKDFLITSTIDGTVSFYNSQTEQQYYKKGDEVMAVVPIQADNQYIGYITLSASDSRAVNEGQEVKIKFSDKNGLLEGKVNSISRLPKDDAREVKVDLEDVLITSHNEAVTFRQMMSGKAQIIIGEKRFITRIFNELTE